jgi:hypothetical protein
LCTNMALNTVQLGTNIKDKNGGVIMDSHELNTINSAVCS